MNERFNRIKSDLRFWWWRAKNVNARRYFSLIVIITVLASLSLVSSFQTQKVKAATVASWRGDQISLDGSDASYMLLQNGTNTCLWPMNYWSAHNFSYQPTGSSTLYNNYIGNACTSVSGGPGVMVQNNATLYVVGNIPLSNLVVQTGGRVTTAPTDSDGFAVPYSSRSNYFATRYMGFVKLDLAPHSGATTRRLMMRASEADDAVLIESGNTTFDSAIDDISPWLRVAYRTNGQGPDQIHGTFIVGGVTNGDLGTVIDQPLPGSGSSTVYIPVRFTSWDITGGAKITINYKVADYASNGTSQVGQDIISETILPLSSLFPPKVAANPDFGHRDVTNPGMMRFEMSNIPIATGITSGLVDASMENYWTWDTNHYNLAGTADYKLFPRVDLHRDKTFSGFMQNNNNNFTFSYSDPNNTTAGNPFSNAAKTDGTDYNFGMYQDQNSTGPAYMQNYKLQYHDDTLQTGLGSGIKLTIGGDVDFENGSTIYATGKGLPGARSNSDSWGMSGIGGYGTSGATPGWLSNSVDSNNGSDWHDGNGGGGSGAGKDTSWGGYGAGGGGVIGFGSSAYAIVSSVYRSSFGNMGHNGGGGAGIYGIGGIGAQGGNANGTNGFSYRGLYYNFNVDSSSGGMGGGGGMCSHSNLPCPPNDNAGDGGGMIRLTVNGNMKISKSSIQANGTADQIGGGGGGGGMVYLKVAHDIDLSSSSTIQAYGGDTSLLNYTPVDRSLHDVYYSGNGGGGLIKVSAASFSSTPDHNNDPSAWPASPDACTVKDMLNSTANLKIDGGPYAEAGFIDLGFINGNPYCGSATSSGSSGDLQISKLIQQYLGTGTPSDADLISNSTSLWRNVATVIPGKYIRVIITVTNASGDSKDVTVTDTLPVSTMNFANSKVFIRKIDNNGGFANSGQDKSVSGTSFSVTATLDASSSYGVIYTSAVVNPFQ